MGVELFSCLKSEEIHRLRVAYNALFRSIFGFRLRDSVRELQGLLERPTFEELIEGRTGNFRNKLSCSDNCIVRAISHSH